MGKRRSEKRRKARTLFDDSIFKNLYTYEQYADLFTEIAVSSFKWNNVPNTIDTRFIEIGLYENKSMIYFTDEVMGDLCLKCILGGQLDVYNIPLDRRAYASNGYQKNLDRTNSVIIWDNMLHYGTSNKMEIYAKRLSNLDTIIDINCNAQKTPILLKGTQQQRLSLINAYEKYDGNQPVMFGTENFLEGNENAFTVFKTDCPYVADKLYELKVNLWNEALTYLGVASSVIQKKERMIKDEVNRLQGGVMANRYSRLNARQQACEEINRMFGTNMSVEFRDIFEQNKNSDTGSEGEMDE